MQDNSARAVVAECPMEVFCLMLGTLLGASEWCCRADGLAAMRIYIQEDGEDYTYQFYAVSLPLWVAPVLFGCSLLVYMLI